MNFKKILFFLIILSNNSIFSQNFNEIIQKAKVNNFSFFDNLNSTANLSESEKKYLIFQKELQKKGYKYKAKKKDTTFILKTTRDSKRGCCWRSTFLYYYKWWSRLYFSS